MTNKAKSGFLEQVLILKDEQERVQKKTFTKWVNSYLCQLKPPVIVKDLMTDFKDGLLLLNLLEMLTKETLKKETPKNMQRIHCLSNVKTALEFMENVKKIKMVNINPSDVVDGKPAIVLGLVWTAILHFQIEEQEEFLLQALGMENDPNAKVKGQAKKGLMAWTNQALSEKYGINITDFGDCWSDGRAFNALVHNIDPSLIDMDEMERQTNKERLENAFNIAESELGIPKLLDVEDMDKPDEKSVMTYVAQFLKSYPEGKIPDDDMLISKTSGKEMSAIIPPNELDIVNEFNRNVDKSFENPTMKNNYDVFAELMNQKDDVKSMLDNLSNENNPDIGEDKLALAKEDFDRNNIKLKEWQWELDKNLPGDLGSKIGTWLKNAEIHLLKPLPECQDKDLGKKMSDLLKEHEKIFKDKDDILKKYNEIKRNLPLNISKKQLQDIEERLQEVLKNEARVREQMNLIALQADLKEKSKKWNKNLDSWNSPISSADDLKKRLTEFNDSTDGGLSMDKYTNDLDQLIKRKAKFCKENPDIDENLVNFLNQSIIECEEENDELPEKFESSKAKLENVSEALNEIDQLEEKIEVYLKKLDDALQSDNLEDQRRLADQLPGVVELINDIRKKVQEELSPFCSSKLIDSLEKKINDLDDNIESTGEQVINRIEMQEQEIARQQQAAQDLLINNLISESEADIKDVSDWINELENCIGPSNNRSPEDLNNILDSLENFNRAAPDIQNLINQGYQNVIELKRQNEPEKANKIKLALDKLQQKFTNYKDKEIPKILNDVKAMVDIVSDIENQTTELGEFIEEGILIKNILNDSSADVLNKEKKFLEKEHEIMDSIKKDKDLLKKLKDMSNKSNLNINLRPLEEKISASEKTLTEMLQNAKEDVKATNQCDDACKKASNYLNDLTNEMSKDIRIPNDEDGQKAKLKNVEAMENELVKAEELIKEAIATKEESLPRLSKRERDKMDKQIKEMKTNAANLKNKLKESKNDLSDNINNWNNFNETKEVIDNDVDKVVKDLEKSHKQRNGIHGKNCQDKADLLKENEKRLDELNSKERAIDELIDIAKNLGSEKPLLEAQNLKKKFDKQRQDLKKEIQQNKTDLVNHQNLERDMESFKDWLVNADKISKSIELIPNTKEGLIEKQKRLKELNKIKLEGSKLLNNLENLQDIVLDETAAAFRDNISSKLGNVIKKFHSIFDGLDSSQGDIKEKLENIERIDNRSNSISNDMKDISNNFMKCTNVPMDSINDKVKLGKELRNQSNALDLQMSQIEDLKNQCNLLERNDATTDLKTKLKKMEDQCNSLKRAIDEKIASNDNEIKNQTSLEEKLKDFEDLMNQIDDDITNCSSNSNDKSTIEEKVKNLKNIKSQQSRGKDMLNDLSKFDSSFKIPNQMAQECAKAKKKFADCENNIKKMETNLEKQKSDWSNFVSTKDDLDKWADDVTEKMDNLVRSYDGVHAGKLTDKEKLLEGNKKLLQNVLGHETDIKAFIDKSNSLLNNVNPDSRKKATNDLCKKYEKLLQALTESVQQNEKDLNTHENYKKKLDGFHEENKLIIKKVNDEIAQLPNTKDGLKRKLKLYDTLRDNFNKRKEKLVNLESMKNEVLDHSSPNFHEELEQQWDQVVDLFGKTFNSALENQSKLMATCEDIEKTESACEELSEKLLGIEKSQNLIMKQPINSPDDLKAKLVALKDLRNELKELQNPFNELHRKNCLDSNDAEIIKPKLDQMQNMFRSLNESINADVKECENKHKQLNNISSSLNNFSTWLNQISNQIEEQGQLDNLDLNTIKKNLNSLQALRDNIAEHKVDLSRLQTSIDEFTKNSTDDSLQNSLDELSEKYNDLHNQCQKEADKNYELIKLMNKYEVSRAGVLHWIETNTQVLLKCSDYTLNPSQIKSKLLMIENLEKDLEFNGQPKFIEAIQDGEELMNELSGISLQLVAQQNSDLKSDWMEISRQLNQLYTNLKNTTSRSEAFKELSNQLSAWLDDMEHTGMMDSSSLEHHCEIPLNENSNKKGDRTKTLLIELNRRAPDFVQLANMATDLANPSFDIENSQIQNRFNRLNSNLKDKIEKLSRQQDDFDKIKQDLEEIEKWIFQTSMNIINENAEQGSNDNSNASEIEELIQHSNDVINSILMKEPEIAKLQQAFENILSNTNDHSPEKIKELHEDFKKLTNSYNNLKDTASHKRDHLINSIKQWEHYQNLLHSTKDFLDNDMARWWKGKSQDSMRPFNNDSENEFKDILEMENKLHSLKKNLENAAKECEGILPNVTTALSRSHTPSFKNDRRLSYVNSLVDPLFNKHTIPSILPKSIYDELEENLKKLSKMKTDNQENTTNWNNFNREKNSFKNWLDNEMAKISDILKSSPGISNMDSVQRNKLKEIQDEMNYKKPALQNLNGKFNSLTSNNRNAMDPVLKDINKEFEVALKQINKLLNREDKEIEVDFTDEDFKLDIVQEIQVPKLNLNLESPKLSEYRPPMNLTRFTQTLKPRDETGSKKLQTFNFCSQTLGNKLTQTTFKEHNNLSTQTSHIPLKNKKTKDRSVLKILNSLRDINDHLENSRLVSAESYTPTSLLSAIPRSPNEESVRRNFLPSKSYSPFHPSIKPPMTPCYENGLKTPKAASSRPQSRNFTKPLSPNSRLSNSFSDNMKFYVPTKDKFLDLETTRKPTYQFYNSHKLDIPNRQFHVDYNQNDDISRESLKPKIRSKIDTTRKRYNSKNSRIQESLDRINQDASELRNLSEKLRNY